MQTGAAEEQQRPPGRRAGTIRAIGSGAASAMKAAAPKLSDGQRRALDAGANAVIGTVANISIAVAAGLVGGRIGPRAPQVIYAILATGIGVSVADRNQAVGTMLASGGMIALSGMAMKAAVAAITNREVSTDPFDVAERVGRVVYEDPSTPAPTPAPPPPPTFTPSAT